MDFVNFEEAKKRLGKSDEELQELIKKGELRAFRDGAAWKFRKEDIDGMAGGDDEAGDTLMSIDADILFAEEEEVPADSAAETWIAADTEGVFPGGAGVGEEQPIGVDTAMGAPEAEPPPLALSPESDDTSLHDVLSADEVAGVGDEGFAEEPVIAVDSDSGMAAVVSVGTSGIGASRTRIVTLVEPPAHHAAFTFMLGITVVATAIALFAVMAMMQGTLPGLLESIGSGNAGLIILGVGFVAVGIIFGIGYVLDKQRAARDSFGG